MGGDCINRHRPANCQKCGSKKACGKLSAASATWVRFVFGLPIAAIYCLALWNAHAPHIGILNIEFFSLLFISCNLPAHWNIPFNSFVQIT